MTWLIHTYGALRLADIKKITIEVDQKDIGKYDSHHIYAKMKENDESIFIGYGNSFEACYAQLDKWLNKVIT